MGSQSRRFRASETVDSELVYLFLFLFLCLGFLSRPADYGHTHQRAYRGALISEQGPIETLAKANPGDVYLEQMASEVIALADSTRHNHVVSRLYYDFWAAWGPEGFRFFQYSNGNSLDRLKLDSPGGLRMLQSQFATNETCFLGDCGSDIFRIRVLNASASDLSTLDRKLRTTFRPGDYFERQEWTLSQMYVASGHLLSKVDSQRRPWFMVHVMEQIEVVIDNKIPMGTSTESPLNLPSSANCLDSIQMFSAIERFRNPEKEFRNPKKVGCFLTTTIVRLRFLYTRLFETIVHLLYAQVLYSQKTSEVLTFAKPAIGNFVEHFLLLEDWNLSRSLNLDYRRTYRIPNSSALSVSRASTLSENYSSGKYSPVITVVFCAITIFALIAIKSWKRVRNVILLKSNNELDALISEESDLDESYVDDQILYENLLKEAVLVSGEGSSGKVFKVRFLGLECAMKVFHSSARMDFRKESITLLNLSHPHVVKFFCSFRKSFIIMELMDEDLFSFITKIRERRIDYDMPLEVALDVMLQIAEGMSYLHHQGIAHQDLKSLNILLKLQGEFDDPDFQIIAKVADFGNARRFDPRYPKGFVLLPNMNIGTRSWRAPELFHPRGSFWTRFFDINPTVLPKPLDIYGFAVICSELLTKQIPFSNDKDLRVSVLASKLREGHRPALPSTGCPEGLLALIKDCWHGDPVLRPEFHEVRTRLIEVKSSWMSHGERLSES